MGLASVGIELNPRYVEMSQWRLERVTRNLDLPAWYTEEHTREALIAEQGRLAL